VTQPGCQEGEPFMSAAAIESDAARNITRYPWFKFCHGLVFWQAVWFLYFQKELSAAEAILLYAIYDVGMTVLEVPSGYMSDRLGRRFTLIVSALAGFAGAALLALGSGFGIFAAAQALIGASAAFASGTDSALLYESLAAAGRQAEIERQELKAWRYSFCALAVSAVSGGVLTLYGDSLPFLAGAAAFAGASIIAFGFRELPRTASLPGENPVPRGAGWTQLTSLKSALTQPALVWLFALSVSMYVFSHIPFVFGQPFILEVLDKAGFESHAPVVSGSVSTLMMVLSVTTSIVALGLRHRLGLPALLLFAFSMQIALSGMLALTNSTIAIALLLLRMVPDSLSRPFISARIQPMLNSESRATYISLQSFCGRLIFAATLFLASLSTSGEGRMAYPEIRQVLTWYVIAGLFCLGALAFTAGRARIDAKAGLEPSTTVTP
ncbi:MAG TPA: MFS transporter, partial [Alphaproteobacteria bacterium]|nr:MFS transporter [Alphaproteobacteria bacterium]